MSLTAEVAPAMATQRYAAPGAAGTGTDCTQTSPCSLSTAVTGASSGDEVIVTPGTESYDLAATSIFVPGGVTVHGSDGEPRPTIVASSFSAPLEPGGSNVVLRHLALENGTSGALSLSQGIVVRDVIAHSTGGGSTACFWSGAGTLTDSVCRSTSTTNTRGAGGNLSGGTITAVLRNVTAIGNNYGLSFSVNNSNTASTVDAKNVIAMQVAEGPGTADVYGSASGGTSSMTVTMDHSNYDTRLAVGTTGGTASVTDPATSSNQTSAPQFTDATTGDFHETAASPTINAGTDDTANGPTDIDGEPRNHGGAPDIGADEFDAPPVAVDDAPSVQEDTQTTLGVLSNDTDGDGGPKAVQSISPSPSHGTASITGGGDISYQPAANYCGADSLTYTLNGGDSAAVAITVTCVDDPPVAVDDSATVQEDAPQTVLGVRANDTDIDGGPKAVQSIASAPSHGTAQITGGGDVAYQPSADYCGADALTYTLNGGDSAVVSITVTCVDDAPVAVADSATVQPDSSPTPIDVLANDTDVDGGPKAVSATGTPAHGTAAITGGGAGVTYMPAAGYCGSDSFGYTLNGGSSATVSITVGCAPDLIAPGTLFRRKPPKTTTRHLAKFRFVSTEAGSTFSCKLDRKRYRRCHSPARFTVGLGRHALKVKAIDAAGNADRTPAVYRWKVLPRH